jgi:hypothetical protein
MNCFGQTAPGYLVPVSRSPTARWETPRRPVSPARVGPKLMVSFTTFSTPHEAYCSPRT